MAFPLCIYVTSGKLHGNNASSIKHKITRATLDEEEAATHEMYLALKPVEGFGLCVKKEGRQGITNARPSYSARRFQGDEARNLKHD